MSALREPAVWFPTVCTGTGTEVFTLRLAEALGKRGIRTEIAWLPLRAEYAPWTVPVPQPPPWATVAHVNTWLHSRFLPRNLPIVATIHHSMHHRDARANKGFARALYHRYWFVPNERRLLRRAESVVAVSHFVARTAKRTLLNVPMQVVYNGIDTERYRPGRRLRHAGESFRLLYVGAWKKMKGVDLIAPIMRGLGKGFDLQYTGGQAAARDKPSMPPNMHDIGSLDGDAVIATMQTSDALLFPSRSEGFGLVAAEAMACGLPVIVTCGSSLSEIVEDGVTGILCPQDDVAAFAAAVRELTVDRDRCSRMSRAARQRAVEMFGDGAMVDAYVNVYHELTSS